VSARSDRRRRQGSIGTDERQVISRGRSLARPQRPGAVRTHEHEPPPDEGAVARHEQLRSDLANETSTQANPARALLAEFGKEHRPPFLEGRELNTKLFQLAVDPCQFGPRLLFSQVPLAGQGPGETFDLAAEQPEPRVPMYCGRPVLQLARVDRCEDLILRQAIL